MKKAVILLSGGLDSAVTAYIARRDVGRRGELYALTFDYGQRHSREIESSNELVGRLSLVGPAFHFVIKLPTWPGASALLKVSGTRGEGELVGSTTTDETESRIGVGWVPQRNSVFLALAFAYAETVGADWVYAGMNYIDYSGYPDCRPEFVEAMNKALNLASKRYVETGKGIGVVTPLMYTSKADIVRKALSLGVPLGLTWSCYQGGDEACGLCDSCRIRRQAFKDAGLVDPIPYEN